MLALTRLTWLLAIWTTLSGCHPIKEGSSLKDIYSSDDSNASRRHEASALEINWTVRAQGCSALLLSPKMILSASHCKIKAGNRLQSGWSVLTDGSPDIVVESVLEENTALDYSIAQIKWQGPIPSAQTYPPYIATAASDVFLSQAKEQGDYLYTVGFPDDKSKVWKSTYAEGQAKSSLGSKLFFNIGVINGSSGGGVLRKENNMLVAIAIGGNNAYQDAGWNKNSEDDAKAWNYGTPSWAIYALSSALKQQFPNGKNIYFGETFFPKSKVYLSLRADGDRINLRVAGSHDTDSVVLCPKSIYPCNKSSAGAETLKLDLSGSGRRFYSSRKALSKSEVEKLGVVAFDKSGQVIGQRRIAVEASK